MRRKDHGISRGQNGNGVRDDGSDRVVRGRDGCHNSEGGVFHQGKTFVAGVGTRLQVFNSWCAGSAEDVLLRLVFGSAHIGFLDRHSCPKLRVCNRGRAHGFDNGPTRYETEVVEQTLRFSCGGYSCVHAGKYDHIAVNGSHRRSSLVQLQERRSIISRRGFACGAPWVEPAVSTTNSSGNPSSRNHVLAN